MKFSINDFFSKIDQIRSFLAVWIHFGIYLAPDKSLEAN